MRRTMAAWAAAALLAASLAGCSMDGGPARTDGTDGAPSDYGASLRGLNGRDAAEESRSRERYARMLENARVHDTDGYLLDGENAHYNTLA